jgi:hypothetical protein
MYVDQQTKSEVEVCKAKDVKTITPCNTNSLQKIIATRPAGKNRENVKMGKILWFFVEQIRM